MFNVETGLFASGFDENKSWQYFIQLPFMFLMSRQSKLTAFYELSNFRDNKMTELEGLFILLFLKNGRKPFNKRD